MENLNKLLIITSPRGNGNEFRRYWGLTNDHSIVKDGYDKPTKVVYGGKIDWGKLHSIIDDTGYLVMIHLDQTPRFEEREFEKDGKEIVFFVYYYTTQDDSLNGDLWTIGSNYSFPGDAKNSQCPFDKLRMAINTEGASTDDIVTEIIDWVKNKTTTQNLLNIKLDLLHRCLNQETAEREIGKMQDYGDVKDLVVEGITVDNFVKEHLLTAEPNDYNNQLIILRDALLNEEVFRGN